VARFEIIEGEAGALDGGAALIEDARGEFAAGAILPAQSLSTR